jgi:metallo-beta-lactamase class B
VNADLAVKQISEHCYVHISYAVMGSWGRIPSNGCICVDKGEALLFDTPVSDSLTTVLIQWIQDSLHSRIVGFVPNHFHDDCMGGLNAVHRAGIPSYANILTQRIAAEKKLPIPQKAFQDSLLLNVGSINVVCKYFGAAHTKDNIVTWIPSEKILFGGCMVKELKAKNIGNVEDADLTAWPNTLEKVRKEFSNAKIVIPGHGELGNLNLIQHTLELLKK